MEVNAEDIARLSPLCYFHINMIGRYHFEISEVILQGEVRPLREENQRNEFEEFDD